MALIKLGGLVTDIRGAIGGLVFGKGKGGNIARSNKKPINPQSNRQGTVRGNQAYITRHWSNALTVQQRADWNAYAAGTTWTNRLGDTIGINGNAAFGALNTLLLLASLPIRAEAPTAMGRAGGITIDFDAQNDLTILALDEPGGAFDKDLDDDVVILFAALPVEGGVARSTRGFQFIGVVEGDSVTAPTFPTVTPGNYTFQAGQKITMKAVHIDPDFRTASATFFTVIAAPSI